jgi:exodeoxyribonuclease V
MTDKRLTVNDLSEDQRAAYDKIMLWIRDINGSPILTLGGVAGSGKSSLIGILGSSKAVSPIAYITYTGKASSVLKRKLAAASIITTNKTQKANGSSDDEDCGFIDTPYCGTIHSLIYAPVEDEECETCAHGKEVHTKYDDDNPLTSPGCNFCACINYKARSTGRVNGWRLREALDRPYKLIVVDESSAVSDDMLGDIQSYNIPILAVGDHAQLPPIGGLGTLVANPEIRLEKIHRQAEGSPIIRMSKLVRETGQFSYSMKSGDTIMFDRVSNLQKHIEMRYAGADSKRLFELGLIVGTNKRRIATNQAIRRVLGRSGPPTPGEQIICLRNQRDKGIYNGMRGLVEEVITMSEQGRPWCMTARVRFPEDGFTETVSINKLQFNREKPISSFDELKEFNVYPASWNDVGGLFDWGYTMTAHKVQGSQFEDVLIIASDWMGSDENTRRRWRYTSCTRAVSKLTVLMP